MSTKKTIRLLAIIAGTNDPSNTAVLAEHFLQGATAQSDIATESVRLKDLHIDHFTLDYYRPDAEQGEDFFALQQKIIAADGILIASPIWNFSVPAHLKNLIDRMGSFSLDAATRTKGQLGGKPVYILFAGGVSMFVWNSMMENTTSFLREALKYFGATVVGTHFEPKCVNGDRTFGLVLDKRPDALAAVKQKGAAFANIVQTFAETGALPAGQRGKSLFYATAQWVVKRMT